MKNYLLLFIVFLSSFTLHAQLLAGMYSSSYTSFESKVELEENYEEEGTFIIAINIENLDEGLIAIQDTKTPDKITYFEIESLYDTFKIEDWYVALYEAKGAYTSEGMQAKLFIYFNPDGTINLLVKKPNSSQVFHGLTSF